MLKSVLSEKTCGQCRNCCVFYSKSRWETPSVPIENAEKIRRFLKCETAVEENGNICKMKSIARSEFPDGAEEYKCPALDESSGCTLPAELKPIECSMWPLRVMKDGSDVYITLATGCHAVDDDFTNAVNSLLKNGLYEKIAETVRNDRAIIRDYDSSYLKLMKITEDN